MAMTMSTIAPPKPDNVQTGIAETVAEMGTVIVMAGETDPGTETEEGQETGQETGRETETGPETETPTDAAAQDRDRAIANPKKKPPLLPHNNRNGV